MLTDRGATCPSSRRARAAAAVRRRSARRRRSAFAEDQRELLAADAGRHVDEPARGTQQIREAAEGAVSLGVSEPVVDRLEVIEVEERDRERRVRATRPLDLASHDRLEGAAVHEAGEHVRRRGVLEVAHQPVDAFAQRCHEEPDDGDHGPGRRERLEPVLCRRVGQEGGRKADGAAANASARPRRPRK